MEKSFKTKTGFCHVTKDQLILTRDGIIGGVSKVIVGNGITRILIIYILISLGLIYFAYDSYRRSDLLTSFVLGLLALYLIKGITTSLNNSATPIIDRKDIKAVKLIKGISGVTRSRFEIDFIENGKTKKRLILLPGSLTDGQSETERAVKIMKEEKLIADE